MDASGEAAVPHCRRTMESPTDSPVETEETDRRRPYGNGTGGAEERNGHPAMCSAGSRPRPLTLAPTGLNQYPYPPL
ncbi:hypothetical protein GCM10010207_86870 [Streptomyces atratus]|nr:hypothetical protein GCM10010207_86870 [Streptomyces atratus]